MIDSFLNKRYRLEAELGQGGMGVVYRAHDTLLDRPVAVKLLSESSRDRLGSQGQARLLREAQSAAQLNHPNIVSIYDAGEADGLPYIVMEYIQGESLFEQKPDTIPEITAIAVQVAAALHHAHTHGIIHRDLKPENIIVSKGLAKLTDFGLARSAASRLSADNLIIGTVLYLAPEAALGQGVDARSDLYSFGVILYELLTGSLPFLADDPLAVISQHLYAPVPPPHAHRPDLPPALEALILHLLEKQPDARPNSALEVHRTLETLHLELAHSNLASNASLPIGTALPLDRLVRGRLVGRTRELIEMKAVLKQSLSGQGSVLLVSGEPGIGKTRLARELAAHAAVSGVKVFSGACYAEGGAPYAPFPQLIRDSFISAGAALELPDFAVRDLIAVAPELSQHFSYISGQVSYENNSEQARLFESLSAWAVALSSKAPLLLFIDDIQWADASTLHLIRHLARRLQNQPALCLFTYRETELNEGSSLQAVLHDLNRERLSTRIKLTRFERAQTQALLEAMLTPASQIEPSLVEAIHRETEGNPFFIEEVTKALLEEGRLKHKDERWCAPSGVEIEIPQSVRLTIQNRLARLPEETQEILGMAAIIGRRFEFSVLSKASQMNEDKLIEALETAERMQILSEVSQGRGSPTLFSFAHALIPTTLRESVSRLRRQRLHRRVAQAIEEVCSDKEVPLETVAYHYEQASDAERAEHYYTLAADRALNVYANQEAVRYYRLALEMEPEGAKHAHLLGRLGEALFRQGHYQEAQKLWLQSSELFQQAGRHGDMAYLYARAARAAWYDSDSPSSLSICLEGISAVKGLNLPSEEVETPGLAALLHETSRSYLFNEMYAEALPLCKQALDMAKHLGMVEVQAEALATLGILPNQPVEERENILNKAVELAEGAGLLISAARAHINLGGFYFDRLQPRLSVQHLERACNLGAQMGIGSWEHGFLGSAANIRLELGEFHPVEDALEKMKQIRGNLPNSEPAQFFADLLQAKLLRFKGELAAAIDYLKPYMENEQIRKEYRFMASLQQRYGDILIEMGQYESAIAMLGSVIGKGQKEDPQERSNARGFISMALAYQGQIEEAYAFLVEAERAAVENSFSLYTAAELGLMRAVVEALAENWTAALSSFETAAQVFQQADLAWLEALTWWKKGEAIYSAVKPVIWN
jgi:tetratricopeptide (TPR) repeat protein/predicted Ser/Thr protein kinase